MAIISLPPRTIRPIQQFVQTEHFRAVCSGPPTDWSLAKLYPGTMSESPFLPLRALLRHYRPSIVYAPSVAQFNAQPIKTEEFNERIMLDNVSIWRNKERPADGMIVPHGCGFMMSAGGCPLLVLHYRGEVFAAHAGRDCLWDRQYLLGKARERTHSSICFAGLAALGVHNNSHARQVRAWVFFSIKPAAFMHWYHGCNATENQRMADEFRRYGDFGPETNRGVQLDLPLIIRNQLMSRGVLEKNIEVGEHAYLTDDMWNTRDGRGGADKRNLILLIRD